MGVYNPFAELPNSCVLCDSREKCDLHREYAGRSVGRHSDCPLVEVKAPHGRLIDADALGWHDAEKKAHNEVVEVARISGCGSPTHQYYSAYYDGLLTMTSKIRFAPTIIEAEE